MECVFYRPDRLAPPVTSLPLIKIEPDMIWIDDPRGGERYNTLQRESCVDAPLSHEKLWRDDHVYDLLIVTDYNRSPVIPYAGSAIFIHLISYADGKPNAGEESFGEKPSGGNPLSGNAGEPVPTHGCLGLSLPHLLTLVQQADMRTRWVV